MNALRRPFLRRAPRLRRAFALVAMLPAMLVGTAHSAPGGEPSLGERTSLGGMATTADGGPLSGRVRLHHLQTGAASREIRLDANGGFRFDDLTREAVSVELVGDDGLLHWVDGLGLPHAAPLRIQRPADLRQCKGYVRDAAGQAVSGATVRSWTTIGAGRRVETLTTTAADGAFALLVHPDGLLRIEASGFEPLVRSVPRSTDAGSLRMQRWALLSGRARHRDGRPAAGTTVWARPVVDVGDLLHNPHGPEVVTPLAVADRDGRFGPISVAPGSWTVFALGAGVVSREVAAAPSADAGLEVRMRRGVAAEIELLVEHAASVAGVVVDTDGRRVPDAEVIAAAVLSPTRPPRMGSQHDGRPEGGPVVRTDALGRFVLDALVPGRVARLIARRANAYGPWLSRTPRQAERLAPITLVAPAQRTLTVRVLDADGLPCAQTLVAAIATGDVATASAEGVTGDDGIATLLRVPDGDLRYTVQSYGADARVDAELVLGDARPARIQTLRARLGASTRDRVDPSPVAEAPDDVATFTIRVTGPDGMPIFGARLDASCGGLHRRDVELGSATISVLASTARVRIYEAYGPDGAPLPLGPLDREFPLEADGGIALVLPMESRLAGRLLESDGRPAVGAEVQAVTPEADSFTPLEIPDRVVATTRTDADGRWALGSLEARTYDVVAPARPARRAVRAYDVPAGTQDLVLRAGRAVDVTITVVDALGRPVPDAPVWVAEPAPPDAPVRPYVAPSPWMQTPPQVTTDAVGRVRLVGLDPDAPYRLDVGPPAGRGDVLAARHEPWYAADVEVTLPPGLKVGGTVVDPAGRPVPWAQVRAFQRGVRVAFSMVDAQGRFVVEGVAAGAVELTATLLGVPGRANRVDARATADAGATQVSLVVDPGPTLVVRAVGARFSETVDRYRTWWGTGSALFDDGPEGEMVLGHVEDGALVFRRVRPGRPYTLWIPFSEAMGGTWLESGAALVAGERWVTLEPGAPIRGRADARPTTRFLSMSGVRRPSALATRGPVAVEGRILEGGTFEFPPLPRGRWTVRLRISTDDGPRVVEAEAAAGDLLDLYTSPEVRR